MNTGGPLNLLNGKMGISAPGKSVPVMALIRKHNPKSKDELVELIKSHYLKPCSCNITSQGTVKDFGKNLYNAQIEFWGEYRYSLKECIQWEYELFIVNSLKGGIVEKKVIQRLKTMNNALDFKEAEGYLDEDLRIDMLVISNGKEIAGIQVKPESFNKMRSEVLYINREGHKKWGKPVFYLFYDKNENFTNIDLVLDKIKKI